MTNDTHTTPTINGLRLVTPQEAGYRNVDTEGADVAAVLLKDGLVAGFLTPFLVTVRSVRYLQELPKPRTTRLYKRGEVKLGDAFRNNSTGSDSMVTRVDDRGVWFSESCVDYAMLLKHYQKLTYDSEGREVISEAGVETDA